MTAAAMGLRVVAAIAAGARPAGRGRSAVVHLYVGPASPTGRFAVTAGRVLCGVRTLRLPLLERPNAPLDLGGRRFCRRCTSLLPPSMGRDVHRLVTRDEVRAAYGHLTVDDFAQAAAWTRTVEETHQVARFASTVLGAPKLHGVRTLAEQAVYDLDRLLVARRAYLTARERTPEENEDLARIRDAWAAESARLMRGQRLDALIDKVVARRKADKYLTRDERALLDSA